MARLTAEKRKEKEEHARLLFTKENITDFAELEQRTGISQKTLRAWEKEGKWTKLKRNIIFTRDEQITLLYDEFAELNEAIRTKQEGSRYADHKESIIRRQLVKDIKELETKAMIPEIINALTQFLNFVRKDNLDNTKLVADYVDLFIKYKIRG